MKNIILIENCQEKEPVFKETHNLINVVITKSLEYMGVDNRCEVSVTLTDDEHIHKLNREHRNVDKPTDVLSFPQYEADELDNFDPYETVVLGDIVISLEHARKQSEEYGHSYIRELAFLCVHSVLHLLGYDHIEKEDEKVMLGLQKEILNEIGITRK